MKDRKWNYNSPNMLSWLETKTTLMSQSKKHEKMNVDVLKGQVEAAA